MSIERQVTSRLRMALIIVGVLALLPLTFIFGLFGFLGGLLFLLLAAFATVPQTSPEAIAAARPPPNLPPRRRSPTTAQAPPVARSTRQPAGSKRMAVLPGTDRGFFVEVSGESFYQPALRALQGLAGDEPVRVLLVPEPENPHDANAVAVKSFEGQPLGYLTRQDAPRYQPTLLALRNGGRAGVCSGRLTGGTEDKPTVGLCLDIESPTKVAKAFSGDVFAADFATFSDAVQKAEVSLRSFESPLKSTVTNASAKDLDPHGQPFNVLFNRARRTERDLSEVLGLAKGMLADGVVTEGEAMYLRAWGANHPDALTAWPMAALFARLQKHFVDGRIDEAERADLQTLLASLVGGTASVVLGDQAATTLPLDAPAPVICWGPDEVYVFTGRFAYGTRADCEREVTSRDCTCEKAITQRTSFLVIGSFASQDWAHSSYGRKIEHAVHLRDSGSALRIVGEDHWVTALTAVRTLDGGAVVEAVRGPAPGRG